jgi:hypothetical protein
MNAKILGTSACSVTYFLSSLESLLEKLLIWHRWIRAEVLTIVVVKAQCEAVSLNYLGTYLP